ncbi:MAG: hypothetical protein A3H98_02980 [Bacteroidetes bacterium RIFCSPLOWO2_02_FULL_36_8]|nr:MAG: hypothetical protein A3H98_02980 [Bacteroidetes bacterium RIFCSPLOWO2_02_FULL_36_8]OFY71485.1 MAG: hypothetical protein A3G23_11260 [Bacteroidetes bacterium RIFCSPLOWO2_12_FULL_37_12]
MIKLIKYFIVKFIFCFIIHSVASQDVHFSQYLNSHLTLNPALTGFFQGNIRSTMNYRSQWASVSNPFISSSFSFDSKILQEKMKDNGLGLGVVILSDKSGSAKLTNFMALLSTSYIKALNQSGNQYLSFGIQGGFFQKKMDFNNLIFGNQFDGLDFNSSLSSGENASGSSFTNSDINIGFLFNRSEPFHTRYNAGLAFFHLNQPEETFLGSENNRSLRTVIHSNILFIISEELQAGPDLFFAYQKKANEINFGGSTLYKLEPVNDKDTYLNFTIGLRWMDAIHLTTGVKYDKWNVSFSYDITISDISLANNYQGGFEISVIYTDLFIPGKNKLPFIVPCNNF